MSENKIDSSALHRLSYGLFVLTSRDASGRDNGCIINTAQQVTESPKRISVTVNKSNFTHDMIHASGEFNVSVLSVEATFDIFRRFGFASGRDTDKFAGYTHAERSSNGLLYVCEGTNSVISAKVITEVDCGTHTLFVADVTEAAVISAADPATYAYYFANIKPKPQAAAKNKYVCSICGYVYEGETLPPDFICPLCLHGAEYFEKQ